MLTVRRRNPARWTSAPDGIRMIALVMHRKCPSRDNSPHPRATLKQAADNAVCRIKTLFPEHLRDEYEINFIFLWVVIHLVFGIAHSVT
jgi:hypothetical protein